MRTLMRWISVFCHVSNTKRRFRLFLQNGGPRISVYPKPMICFLSHPSYQNLGRDATPRPLLFSYSEHPTSTKTSHSHPSCPKQTTFTVCLHTHTKKTFVFCLHPNKGPRFSVLHKTSGQLFPSLITNDLTFCLNPNTIPLFSVLSKITDPYFLSHPQTLRFCIFVQSGTEDHFLTYIP